MEWIRISTDPFNADGPIINEATQETWLMEHVFACVHDGPGVDVTSLLPVPRTLNSIMVANRTGRTPLGEFGTLC